MKLSKLIDELHRIIDKEGDLDLDWHGDNYLSYAGGPMAGYVDSLTYGVPTENGKPMGVYLTFHTRAARPIKRTHEIRTVAGKPVLMSIRELHPVELKL